MIINVSTTGILRREASSLREVICLIERLSYVRTASFTTRQLAKTVGYTSV